MIDLHYFIGDLHLGHRKVLEHDNRPFPTIEEHDAHLTETCASAGEKNRTLWILGDVANRREVFHTFMDRVVPCWGAVNLIRGNHDDRIAWRFRERFSAAYEALYVRISPEVRLYLSHYACRTWRGSNRGSYHIHAHSHGALPRLGRSTDVGANCINYRPINLGPIIEALQDCPHTDQHEKIENKPLTSIPSRE